MTRSRNDLVLTLPLFLLTIPAVSAYGWLAPVQPDQHDTVVSQAPLPERAWSFACDETPDDDPISADGSLTKPQLLLELETLHLQYPDDSDVTDRLVDAMYRLGVQILCRSRAEPDVTYPRALDLFRSVIDLEPRHSGAKVAAEAIEDVYRAIGRPVPNKHAGTGAMPN